MGETMLFRTVTLSRHWILFAVLILVACSDQSEQADQVTTTPEPVVEATVEPAPEVSAGKDIPISAENDQAKALYEEGQALLDVGRNIEARAKFMAAVELEPTFALGYYGRANAALSFKEFEESMESAEAHLEGVSEGERLMIAINRTFTTNDAGERLRLADELVKAYPESPRAFIVRANARGGQNDNTRARDDLEQALLLEPDSIAAVSGLASSYLFGEPKDFEAAEEWAYVYIEAYPREAKAYEMLGDVHRGLGNLEGAAEAYAQAEEVDPTLWLAAHKNGHVNSFLGNIDAARAAYDRGIELATPENKSATATYKAFTRIHQGDIATGIAELEALAEGIEALGTPSDQVKGAKVFALTSAATTAMHAGMLDKAADLVERRNDLVMAIAEDVGTADARRLQQANTHLFSGLLAAHQGKTLEAEQHAEAIMALVADDDNERKLEPAYYVLGMAALKAGNNTTAVEHLSLADHANNMYIRYQLALAEEASGDAESAARHFDEVANFNFNSVGFALVGRDAKQKIDS